MVEKDNVGNAAADVARIAFHYIKSNQFRVIHVDGAHGGLTPSLKIQMALFSERTPIPQKAIHRLSESGRPVEPAEETIAREGIVREVEVEALFDVTTARSLIAWLQNKVDMIERIEKELARGNQP